MRRADVRLRRLEALVPPECAVCRTWGPAVYQIGDAPPERPERCPDCGRVVAIELLRHVVLVPPEDGP